MLVTQRDALRMQINAERREINSVADYMRLYLKILHLVFEYGIISASQRDGIANYILVAIQNAAKDNDVIVSNYVYAISMRFMTLSNYDCWELMRNVTCQEDANKFVAETKSWYQERALSTLEKANHGYKMSFELRNASIISTWEDYLKLLKNMSGSLEVGSKVNLKSMHNAALDLAYETMHLEKGLTYLDRVEDYLRKLEIETSILIKIDAGKVIKSILKERRKKIETENSFKLEEAIQKMSKLKKMLAEVEKFYGEILKKALASDKAFQRIYDEFEEAHPEMSEEELEDAFDEYWLTCPEYFSECYEDVSAEYSRKKKELQRCINEQQITLEQIKDEIVMTQEVISGDLKTVTLGDILKEYTIAFLAKEGRIVYPSSPIEKEEMFFKISHKMAAMAFLQNEGEKITFSAEEINYLMN